MTISVIIPAYNGSRFIEQAILSVLEQQRKADQILVCDDNSGDDTLAICERYKEHISILTNPDGPSGFVNAWNRAIASADGEFISILHQDDILAPEFLRIGADALERNPGIRHLFSTCQYIDEQGRILSQSYPSDLSGTQRRNTSPENGYNIPRQSYTGTEHSSVSPQLSSLSPERRYTGLEYVTSYQNQGHPHIHRCPGVITHKSIFGQCRYEPSAGHIADDDFFYRVGMYTDIIGILSPLASYRVHSGSVTGSMNDAALVGQLMEDYIYQCRQWKDHPFLNEPAYDYFFLHAKKYIRRYIGYGIKQQKAAMILRGIKKWSTLYKIILLRDFNRMTSI